MVTIFSPDQIDILLYKMYRFTKKMYNCTIIRNWDTSEAKRIRLDPDYDCSVYMTNRNYGVWRIDDCYFSKRPYICHQVLNRR